MESSARLSRRARTILANADNRILLSAAVAWELAIKVNLGKIRAPLPGGELAQVVERQRFVELAITIAHAVAAGLLPLHHRDPFDRLLVAQAQSLRVPILSADVSFDRYQVERVW
jgi:PIN domain nuclease of toxin-antitoxin system